jgi:hypothetical protein
MTLSENEAQALDAALVAAPFVQTVRNQNKTVFSEVGARSRTHLVAILAGRARP